MKKTIFFDFFGVISEEVAVRYFNRKYTKELAQKVKDKIFVRADRGDILEEETYRLIAEETGDSYENIKQEWQDLVEIREDVVNFILELKKDHKVYLLSNAISSYLRDILETHDLYKCFDKVFISAELHKIKPNADYFLYALDDLRLDPKECIMIDDNPANIKGAVSVGINGIVYKNLDQLKEDIKKLEL